MSVAGKPTIPTTGNHALDGEIADLRRRLAFLEQRLGAAPQPTAQSAQLGQVPAVGFPLYIGEPVQQGTAGRVLYEGAGSVLADSSRMTFDDSTGAHVVQATDLSMTKAYRGTENTSSTNTSYSSFTAERISSAAIAAGFGVGYGFNAGENGGASIQWGAITCEYDGSSAKSAMLFRVANSGTVQALCIFHTGQVSLLVAGAGLSIKEGSNCKMGQATLSGGTVTVSNTSVTASSRIFLCPNGNTNEGMLSIGTITAGTSFVINSSNGSDARTVNYLIMEPS